MSCGCCSPFCHECGYPINRKNECEHGQLARSCNICEYEQEIAELEAESAGWKAREDISAKQVIKQQATIERLEAVIGRMLPKLREHMTDEYIKYELIKGTE